MRLVGRHQWGAAFGNGDPLPGAVALVVIHHTATADLPPNASQEVESQAVRSIESDHSEPPPKGNGWNGIGYNHLVFPSGRVYEGRGWRRVGAHTEDHNSKSVGIAFVMNAQANQPTPPAMQAVRDLIAFGLVAKHIAEPFEIKGHRDFKATKCPGDLLYPRIQELRPPAASLEPAAVTRAAIAEIRKQLALIEAVL